MTVSGSAAGDGASLDLSTETGVAYSGHVSASGLTGGSWTATAMDITSSTILAATTIAQPQTATLNFTAIGPSTRVTLTAITASSTFTITAIPINFTTWTAGTIVTTVCSKDGDAYRYGFNGKLKDNEWAGIGNSYDYGARMEDARIARFRSVDPLTKKYPWYTPYQFAGNKPTVAIDIDGLEEYYDIDGNKIGVGDPNNRAKMLVVSKETSNEVKREIKANPGQPFSTNSKYWDVILAPNQQVIQNMQKAYDGQANTGNEQQFSVGSDANGTPQTSKIYTGGPDNVDIRPSINELKQEGYVPAYTIHTHDGTSKIVQDPNGRYGVSNSHPQTSGADVSNKMDQINKGNLKNPSIILGLQNSLTYPMSDPSSSTISDNPKPDGIKSKKVITIYSDQKDDKGNTQTKQVDFSAIQNASKKIYSK